MTQTIENKALSRIYGNGRGWAFSQNDFAELGSRSAIDLALHRLTNQATIRRVIRGIYDYPRYSDLLQQEIGPDIYQVADALARKFGWRIQPSGSAAQNLIGLSTQVPSQYSFQSDGPDRCYLVGNTSLQFKHGALKEAGLRHRESGLIVQAIKTLGEANITDETINAIRQWLPQTMRQKVLKDTSTVTGWVYAAIKRICQDDERG